MRGAFTCLGQGHWYCNQTLPTLYINKIFSRAEAYLLPIKPSASQSEQVMTAVVWEFLDIKLVWVKTHENIITSSITLHYVQYVVVLESDMFFQQHRNEMFRAAATLRYGQ